MSASSAPNGIEADASAPNGIEADASVVPLPGGRMWFYVRGLCLAYLWIVFGLCLHYAWPDCPLLVRYVAGGIGILATMAIFVSPQTTSSSRLSKRVRVAASAAVVLAYTILGVVLLSSAAPSRVGAYVGTVFACGIVLCGVNSLSMGKRGIGSRRAVGCGVALTVLSLAGSLLSDTLFQLLAWSLLLLAQLPVLVGWPSTGWGSSAGADGWSR